MTQDLCFLSAVELSRRIRRGDVSSADVVDAHLTRIEAFDDDIKAYITVDEHGAREQAERADRALDAGTIHGPLHGVPVAVKDLDPVAGMRTTYGSRVFDDYIPDTDAPFVSRLKSAGAIILGKTNTPEFGLGTVTDNEVTGPTANPFDLSRTAGGSSGGSGAAVAAGMAPIAQGSDVGGSLRIPAAFCGVYCLKPSFGLVPRVYRPDGFEGFSPYSYHGPMTRTVEDAALFLDVLKGPHPRDPFALPENDTDYVAATRESITDLDIAYSPDLGTYPVSGPVRDILDETVDAFDRAGANVEAADPDFRHTQEDILDAFYTYAIARWKARLDNMEEMYGRDIDLHGEDQELLRDALVETIVEADQVSMEAYRDANLLRTRLYDAMQDLFEEYDLLLAPTVAVPAFPFDELPTEVDGTEIEPERGWLLTQPYNLVDCPVASVPGGFTNDHLPVGIQVIGPRYDDETVLAASATFERMKPWHDEYPA